MAQRRMFSVQIVGSDAFLEMPTSTRELYFQLGMYADDDGFISPRKIMRMIGSPEDDLKMLIAKRFVLPFENGVVVIKHWLINNLVRKDFYKETNYLEQKKQLFIKENKAYTFDKEQGISIEIGGRKQNVNNLLSQVRLGKDNIPSSKSEPLEEEISIELEDQKPKKKSINKDILQIFSLFSFNPAFVSWRAIPAQREAATTLLQKYGFEKTKSFVEAAQKIKDKPMAPVVNSPYDLLQKLVNLKQYEERRDR